MARPEHKKTVLIVEDQKGLADLYTTWLQNEEYETHTAYDGYEAIDLLDSVGDQIDAALLDRRMPGYNGDEVLEEILNRNIECGVSMVTAVAPEEDDSEMGFDIYLEKSVTKEEILETVEKLL